MQETDGGGFSKAFGRRKFLKGLAATAGAAAIPAEQLLGAAARKSCSSGAIGPSPVPITLQINGKERRLEVEPRVTLLEALRNGSEAKTGAFLDLTGTKRVCDRASCGACTVIVDGRAIYSCSMLAIEAQGKEIVTVEGLGTPEKPHPLQQAFVETDGLMCGFCTPGFVVAAKCLLDKNPKPDSQGIRSGLNGNICRCGTYSRVFEAVELAASRMRKGG